MAKVKRRSSRQVREERSEPASFDNAEAPSTGDDDSMPTDDTPEVIPKTEPAPPPAPALATVTAIHEPHILLDVFARTQPHKSLVAAFKADMNGKDDFRVVKRPRSEWKRLWQEFLDAPR